MPSECIHNSKKIYVQCNKILEWNPNPERIIETQ